MNVLTNQLPSLFGEPATNMTVNGSDFMNNFLSTASRASPLMQGFLFLYRILEQRFGLDPSLVLTTLGLAWGVTKMVSQIYMATMVFVDAYLRSSITIPENDPIYDHLMKWMSMHPSVKRDRDLMAQTDTTSAWESNNHEDLTFIDGGDDFGQHQYLNFSNQAARSVRGHPRHPGRVSSSNSPTVAALCPCYGGNSLLA